jgi:hypothetical protein
MALEYAQVALLPHRTQGVLHRLVVVSGRWSRTRSGQQVRDVGAVQNDCGLAQQQCGGVHGVRLGSVTVALYKLEL